MLNMCYVVINNLKTERNEQIKTVSWVSFPVYEVGPGDDNYTQGAPVYGSAAPGIGEWGLLFTCGGATCILTLISFARRVDLTVPFGFSRFMHLNMVS